MEQPALLCGPPGNINLGLSAGHAHLLQKTKQMAPSIGEDIEALGHFDTSIQQVFSGWEGTLEPEEP